VSAPPPDASTSGQGGLDAHEPEPLVSRGVGLLRDAGLAEGDRLVVLLPNRPHTFGVLAAACLEGVVPVPLPTDLGAGELAEIVLDADPRAIVADPSSAARARELGVEVLVLDEDRFAAQQPAEPSSSWPRTRPMAYTSGTTGRRKGVYAGVHDAAWGRQTTHDEHAAFDHRHGGLHLVVSPLYHSAPFRFAQVTALTGGRVAILPGFTPDGLLHALRTLRPTSMFCVPTHLHRLLARTEVTADDLASLELLAHAGAPCPTPLKQRLLDLAPADAVWEFYGSTEGQFTVCPPHVWQQAPGTVGHARPGRELLVRDAEGNRLPPGEVGTVWASVPGHATFEYWRDPERTAAAWDGDAFTVGDLGSLDEAGRLTLAGRPGDLVITGGVNVYPAEVERRLLDAPGVAEAVVFGVDDDDWGQRVEAAVVAWPDTTIDPDRLRAGLADELARAKVPKRIHVVADLPRTSTGKIRRDGSLRAAVLEASPRSVTAPSARGGERGT
jgi:long-chain acyl-CoA synthetase